LFEALEAVRVALRHNAHCKIYSKKHFDFRHTNIIQMLVTVFPVFYCIFYCIALRHNCKIYSKKLFKFRQAKSPDCTPVVLVHDLMECWCLSYDILHLPIVSELALRHKAHCKIYSKKLFNFIFWTFSPIVPPKTDQKIFLIFSQSWGHDWHFLCRNFLYNVHGCRCTTF